MSAASALFLASGFDRTAIEDITARAGVAKGTFYLHFKSKADIVDALRQRFIRELLNRILAEVDRQPNRDWPARLAAWARACAQGYLDAGEEHHLVFVATPPETREGLNRNILVDNLADLLASGAEDGAWPHGDHVFLAVFLFNALHGVVNQEPSIQEPPARRKIIQDLESQFLRSVGLQAD